MRHDPKSNIEWRFWAQVDPLYGVWTIEGKNRAGSNPWTEEEFYSTCEPDLPVLCRHWEQYGVNYDSCVEIGCGVGRMTRLLERKFNKMYAVDIAREMLDKASEVSEATFLLTDGTDIPLRPASVSAAFSMIVFQHFQNQEIGFEYLREIFRVLRPGGTLMLNIPTHKFPARLPRFANRVSRGLKLTTAFVRRMALRLPNEKLRRKLGAYMHGTTYDLNRLLSTCAKIGFHNVEMRIFTLPATDNNRASHFLFARKPGS